MSDFPPWQVSYTPIVSMFLNWPPALRQLLASIWLFGILPPKVKDYQQMLLPVVEQLEKYAPGPDGEDLNVWDADTETHRDVRVLMALVLNDMQIHLHARVLSTACCALTARPLEGDGPR